MSAPLIAAVGMIYAGIAVSEYMKGHLPMAVVFTGYAFSNIGLFIIARNP